MLAAEDCSIKIFLLAAHAELNPIDKVWGFVKKAVASRNITFKLSHVEELARQKLNEVSSAVFKNFCDYALIEERKYGDVYRD